MVRRRQLKRVTAMGALVGVLSMMSGLAIVVFGGTGLAAASTTGSLDCSTLYGGDYLATVNANGTVEVTLNPDCQAGPYYLLVYSASGNYVQALTPPPPGCPTYPAGSIDPTDPNSYCSFPSSSDFPDYKAPGSPVEFPASGSVTAPLPSANSCWQIDVVNDFSGTQVSPVTAVDGALGGNFIWGEKDSLSSSSA